MKRYALLLITSVALYLPVSLHSQRNSPITFSGNKLKVIEIEPEKNTGLNKIFVTYSTEGVQMHFKTSEPNKVKVFKYSNLGGGYAEEIDNLLQDPDGISIIPEGNMGYIFEIDSSRYYYWLVDYSVYRFNITNVSPSEYQDCEATLLDVDGYAPPIHYFTINGQQKELSRDIEITYDTQEFDSSQLEYKTVGEKILISSFDKTIRVTPPSLCYTAFHIAGDRFLKEWNWMTEVESIVVAPTAVSIMTAAYQDGIDSSDGEDGNSSDETNGEDPIEGSADSTLDEAGSNIISGGESGLGGSAPSEITFEAYVSEGVLHYEWQFSKDPDFENIDYRFNVRTLEYTFLEEGQYYLRFIGSNSDGSCEAVSDVYTVSIGASELLCPNAFSPDGDGVNDVWKVSYRSLIDFECWIFDRYGAELYHFKDPQDGWDGKRSGKTVKPGVYFYVITATGADGKKYKKSGDINILRHRNAANSSGSSAAE